ncbi:glycopeptide antibiotics resistance protein [Xenococcus sp. PCC 7305]|uniref:VanZ family protein n=1 Tax=Xenococcus sp. PCC 7305 TaxID=102125 RepID=UPI0002AC7556|nr:VanZ family protein [Xenococcus sp. PCC 7305]ELS01431.1 glycopeptide antibiotics resistance protein [Xenococcus sp. PCC 7305]
MAQHHDTKQNLLQFIEIKSQTIIVLSSFIILFVTLLPFDFSYPDSFSWNDLKTIATTVSPPGDIAVNLVLFMPFGWGLATLFSTKRFNLTKTILLTLIVSFSFSTTIEILQIFLLLRRTTPTDVVNNSLSGVLGGVFFLLVRNRLKGCYFSFSKKLFLKIFLIVWLIYLISIGWALISLKDATKLSNWEPQFPLMIGNEQTGNRPWKGEMSYFYLSDRFLPQSIIEKFLTADNQPQLLQDYLLGYYSFEEPKLQYFDQLGNLPSLIWQEKNIKKITKSASSSIVLDENNWLQTEIPPKQLTKKVQNNSQFTIVTKIKSNDKKQQGAARIFSLSENIYQRNLSLEQLGSDLKLRLRTTLTGNNGRNPELILRNFFDDLAFHQIAIAYNAQQLKIYLDSVENIYTLKLNSEAAFFWSILYFMGSKTPIYMDKSKFYNFLYHNLLFMPFGFLLALILIMSPKKKMSFLLIFLLGTILPSLIIETILLLTDNATGNLSYKLLDIPTIAITSLIFRALMTLKFKKNISPRFKL